MKNIFSSRMGAVFLTMWLGVAAGTANAGVLTMSAWEGSASAGYSANFGNPGVSNTFDNWLNFSIPADASGNGEANIIGLGQNIMFTMFSLTEASIGTVYGATGGSTSYLSFTGGAAPGNYQLHVAGTKTGSGTGSYAGNIILSPVENGHPVVSPIPEPETYAMLLAGLGLLGFSARRRKNTNYV